MLAIRTLLLFLLLLACSVCVTHAACPAGATMDNYQCPLAHRDEIDGCSYGAVCCKMWYGETAFCSGEYEVEIITSGWFLGVWWQSYSCCYTPPAPAPAPGLSGAGSGAEGGAEGGGAGAVIGGIVGGLVAVIVIICALKGRGAQAPSEKPADQSVQHHVVTVQQPPQQQFQQQLPQHQQMVQQVNSLTSI